MRPSRSSGCWSPPRAARVRERNQSRPRDVPKTCTRRQIPDPGGRVGDDLGYAGDYDDGIQDQEYRHQGMAATTASLNPSRNTPPSMRKQRHSHGYGLPVQEVGDMRVFQHVSSIAMGDLHGVSFALDASVDGHRITVSVDGTRLIDVTDSQLSAGKVGVNVFDGRAAYQDVVVTALQ